MLKSLDYFRFRSIGIENSPGMETVIKDAFQRVYFDGATVDLLYTKQMDASKFNDLLSKGKLHNDSMILVEGIHRNKYQQKNWKNLAASPKITVSIDMFHCGAIFIRSEQVKEHFTIRI